MLWEVQLVYLNSRAPHTILISLPFTRLVFETELSCYHPKVSFPAEEKALKLHGYLMTAYFTPFPLPGAVFDIFTETWFL